MEKKGALILEDGSIYQGYSFGHPISSAGEVVFTTGMVGYPESLTDPSFQGQILVCTYPLIGNYGVPSKEQQDGLLKNFESEKIHVQGLIVADYSSEPSHWNSTQSLGSWLSEEKIPALYGIDTRALTKKIREKGVMLGKIVFDDDIPLEDPNSRNVVAEVSISQKRVYFPNSLSNHITHPPNNDSPLRIVIIDCGVKQNIIRSFINRGVTVIRVPWDYDFFTEEFDAVFISNGPGDPKRCGKTIEHLQKALLLDKPIFGICLGSQLLALAAGGNTYKLKYGHRGQNQPCLEVGSPRCYITSQNHGFAVDETTLPAGWEPWFVNANDGTNEGIRHKEKPFFSVQFHPEACPGPTDTSFLFDFFIKTIQEHKHKLIAHQRRNDDEQTYAQHTFS
ncbi:MAG TPA: glutamine-hydrolyzing carbamoyl-phosphate synthase small subunit [Candidatus Nanoarchaeia archaeon]|nr:glutamine-hydrolyzing carbamoyl-phosphate synthase small subunit [Candidatus Nanoarchaeia archaeon]